MHCCASTCTTGTLQMSTRTSTCCSMRPRHSTHDTVGPRRAGKPVPAVTAQLNRCARHDSTYRSDALVSKIAMVQPRLQRTCNAFWRQRASGCAGRLGPRTPQYMDTPSCSPRTSVAGLVSRSHRASLSMCPLKAGCVEPSWPPQSARRPA